MSGWEENEDWGAQESESKEVEDITWVSENQLTPHCSLNPPQPARAGRGQHEVEEEGENEEGVQKGERECEWNGGANVNQL